MAPRNSMKKSKKPAGATNNSALDFEFPDWSGMDDSPTRITPEAAFRLSEQYLVMFPEAAAQRRKERIDPEKSQGPAIVFLVTLFQKAECFLSFA